MNKTIQWRSESYGFDADVAVDGPAGPGVYQLTAVRRPHYCDRGDFLMQVCAIAGAAGCYLDDSDGFPRYFFGSDDEVKDQFQRWVNKREETLAEPPLATV